MDPVTIVGGGPVGTVLAMFLARRGYPVTVFERNADPRTSDVGHGSSINLTLCARGLDALDRVGAGNAVRRVGVPVYGRMIHLQDGPVQWQPYGNHDEALLSVKRNELNGVLLDFAQEGSFVDIQFGQTCTGLDPETLDVEVNDGVTGVARRHTARWLIGADGALSAVRAQLLKCDAVTCTQEYAPLAYNQLDVEASPVGWTADNETLHVWPRGHHMLIAIPNRDGSFTAALLLPMDGELSHASITTEAQLTALFETFFPDAVDKIPYLAARYFASRPVPMVTVQCSPWSYAQRVLLVGDAAHAIYPSYGQGANAGFEDCAAIDERLEASVGDLAQVFGQLEGIRRPHTDAIAELSKQHLVDLCSALGTEERTLRDGLERKLNQLFPSYLPLYSMISFTRMPYAQAVQIDRHRQGALDGLAALVADRESWDEPATEALIAEYARSTGLIETAVEAACSPALS
jgi:kynurenine 3-monooxygenase